MASSNWDIRNREMIYNQYRTAYPQEYSCNPPEILVSLCISVGYINFGGFSVLCVHPALGSPNAAIASSRAFIAIGPAATRDAAPFKYGRNSHAPYATYPLLRISCTGGTVMIQRNSGHDPLVRRGSFGAAELRPRSAGAARLLWRSARAALRNSAHCQR